MTPSTKQKLKLGIILDSEYIEVEYYNFLKKILQSHQNFASPVLIIQGNELGLMDRSSIFNKILKNLIKLEFSKLLLRVLIFLIKKVETTKLRRLKNFSDYGKSVKLKLEDFKFVRVNPTISKSGFIYRYSNKELNKIKNTNLDLLIRCGSGILKGEILNLTKFGILSIHTDDNRIIRGAPSGFWEVYKKLSNSGFVIQQLTEELDGGKIIFRGNMTTLPYWYFNSAFIRKKAVYFLYLTTKYIADNRQLPEIEEPFIYDNKLYRSPNFFQLIKYIIQSLFLKIKNVYSQKKLKWSIGFLNDSGFKKSLFRGREIKNPKGRFFADPFLFKYKNKYFCFFEDFDIKCNKGKISVLEIKKNEYKSLGTAKEEPFHLSFPFIFRDKKNIYMIPETSKKKQIRLYQATEFPLKWKLACILIDNIDAADTMVIKKDKVWYLFTNACSCDINDHNSELHIFWSVNLKNSKWIPFKNNPVIFDSKKARNGGLIYSNENIFRVSQSHDFNNYGHSIKINKIINLEKDKFVEKEICDVNPSFQKNINGIHTLNSDNKYTVYDVKR